MGSGPPERTATARRRFVCGRADSREVVYSSLCRYFLLAIISINHRIEIRFPDRTVIIHRKSIAIFWDVLHSKDAF